MMDADTFLTRLYVSVDDYCKSRGIPPTALSGHRGPAPALSPSEVVTLALYSQWGPFPSERSFWRHATLRLRGAFPRLPTRPQLNRLIRSHEHLTLAFGLATGQAVLRSAEPGAAFEVLDSTAVVTRNHKRGAPSHGWLAGEADIGYSSRLGWFCGMRLLAAVSPRGVVTGYGIAPASVSDQPLTTTFLSARANPAIGARLQSVGQSAVATSADPAAQDLAAQGPAYYLADGGFSGRALHERWREETGAGVITSPGGNRHSTSRERWPASLRHWLSHHRQVIESVFDRLLFTLRLSRERPHTLRGLTARLAACVALYNFCIQTNYETGRPLLAFADLIAW